MHTVHLAPNSKSRPVTLWWLGTGRWASPVKQPATGHTQQGLGVQKPPQDRALETSVTGTGDPGQNGVCEVKAKVIHRTCPLEMNEFKCHQSPPQTGSRAQLQTSVLHQPRSQQYLCFRPTMVCFSKTVLDKSLQQMSCRERFLPDNPWATGGAEQPLGKSRREESPSGLAKGPKTPSPRRLPGHENVHPSRQRGDE